MVEVTNNRETARDDVFRAGLEHIDGNLNSYPGRGIILGKKADGTVIQVYWIMGRSKNSRNRIFVSEGAQVSTEAADESAVEDPSLIIYNAVQEDRKYAHSHHGKYIVTNGDQTDTIFDALQAGDSFEAACRTRRHEPDAPNYTPRISGLIDVNHGSCHAKLSVIPKSPLDSTGLVSEHRFYEYDFSSSAFNGLGLMVTTYMGDGKPLPSFKGDPMVVPIEKNNLDEIADFFLEPFARRQQGISSRQRN